MNWQDKYIKKIVSAEFAIQQIKPNATIVLMHAAGEPQTLVEELNNQITRFNGAEIVHMIALGKGKYCEAGFEKHIRHNSLFAGPASRKAIAEKRADFTPTFFSEIPNLFRDKLIPVDVSLIQVSPPNEKGYCSYGVSADYAVASVEMADLVIAEVNEQMPYTFGSLIHISEIDFIIESNRDLLEIPIPKITQIEEQIGQNIASLVQDRDNLQLGIGAIPDAVLLALKDKKDLGIHTEMMSDTAVQLYKEGIITNKYNNLHPGKVTACFLLGTKELYKFVHNNPIMNIQPVDYTNHILVAGKINNLISINSAIEVDLYGQVSATMIGSMQYSGVGGQVDFVRAARISPGGKSIIALPSTAKNNTISKIVTKLADGAEVTTTRNDVDYIVTEYGIAALRGKTIIERQEALINIAHPDFRDKLRIGI